MVNNPAQWVKWVYTRVHTQANPASRPHPLIKSLFCNWFFSLKVLDECSDVGEALSSSLRPEEEASSDVLERELQELLAGGQEEGGCVDDIVSALASESQYSALQCMSSQYSALQCMSSQCSALRCISSLFTVTS